MLFFWTNRLQSVDSFLISINLVDYQSAITTKHHTKMWSKLLFLPALVQAEDYGSTLSFSVVGDWGGQSNSPTTSRGIQTGKSVDRSVTTYQTDFVFLVGDNFYEYGIKNLDTDRFIGLYGGLYAGLIFLGHF